MIIEANTKSKFIKFEKGYRPGLDTCVGKLALRGCPEETQLLRYLYEAMHPYSNLPARIQIDIDGKTAFVANYKREGKETNG